MSVLSSAKFREGQTLISQQDLEAIRAVAKQLRRGIGGDNDYSSISRSGISVIPKAGGVQWQTPQIVSVETGTPTASGYITEYTWVSGSLDSAIETYIKFGSTLSSATTLTIALNAVAANVAQIAMDYDADLPEEEQSQLRFYAGFVLSDFDPDTITWATKPASSNDLAIMNTNRSVPPSIDATGFSSVTAPAVLTISTAGIVGDIYGIRFWADSDAPIADKEYLRVTFDATDIAYATTNIFPSSWT